MYKLKQKKNTRIGTLQVFSKADTGKNKNKERKMKITKEKIAKLNSLNNTLTAKQKQLLAEVLEVKLPISLQDSYVLLKSIVFNYKKNLYN